MTYFDGPRTSRLFAEKHGSRIPHRHQSQHRARHFDGIAAESALHASVDPAESMVPLDTTHYRPSE